MIFRKAFFVQSFVFILSATMFYGVDAHAKIQSKVLKYKQGENPLEGYLAWDDKTIGERPAVVLVHNWMGMTADIKKRADQFAEMGFLVLAADIYGKGVLPKDGKEAGALAGKYKGDRNLLRLRAQAAMDALTQDKRTDKKRILAMGFCFGGTAALELARSGASLAGVVSFHGGLAAPKPEDAKNIRGKVLILHGAIDPYVTPEEVNAFMNEMNAAKVDYQFVAYANTVHAFTEKGAGDDISKGAAYNALSEKRSLVAMKDFVTEVAQKK